MKLCLLALLVFFSSCTYQYFTLSADALSKNANNDFVVENDTLKLTYRFSGDHGPVQITIFNKTEKPLEIDWRKSALIMNGKSYGYYSPNLYLSGNVRPDTLRSLLNSSSLYANVSADIHVNEPSQFIPPRAAISKVPFTLPVHSVSLQGGQLKKETYKTVMEIPIKYKKAEFSAAQSPVAFRSYLSFNYSGDPEKQFSTEQQFYVSEIWQSGSNPAVFTGDIADKGNVFHVVSGQ
jgi:hypothetical protein